MGRNQAEQGEVHQRTIDSLDNIDDDEVPGIIVPVSPVEERDAKIATLEKDLESLQEQVKEVNNLKDNLIKVTAENRAVKKTTLQLTKKLNLTRKTNEIKLAEMITTGSTEDSPHLITAYTATLCEDDFDLDVDSDEIKPKNDTFLKSIEDRCDLQDEDQKNRYSRVRNQVLERVKKLMTSSPSRDRRSSISSISSLKRELEESDTEEGPLSKPRFFSPQKTQE